MANAPVTDDKKGKGKKAKTMVTADEKRMAQ